MEMNIGERITHFRSAKGYTVNKLANMAGVSQSNLRDIELGNNNNPSIELLDCLCDAMGITLKEFFDVDNDFPLTDDPLQKEIFRLNPHQRENLYVFLKSMQNSDLTE
jgi:transcriptional regulator with XRE-family HTH domain